MEWFDICDENGIPTGKTVSREQAHREGILHRTAHVWVIRKENGRYQILLQKRSEIKDSFPGLYDTSSAGHIPAGCEPPASAVRELQEELGITAEESELHYTGRFRIKYEKVFHGKLFRDNEISDVYVYDRPVDTAGLVLQESEVSEVRWFDLQEVCEQLDLRPDLFCIPKGGLEALTAYLASPEALVREAFEEGLFNGTWLYAENGEIVSKGAVGFRDAQDRLPMREDSTFELASITKQFTAAAVMQLVRAGKLSLEDEVTKYYPGLPYPGVTIRHLLTHTGGIPETYDDDNWIMKRYREEKKVAGSDVVIRFLMESGEKPRFAPGEKYEYTNGGYNLLAEIVAKVSGVPFESYLRENIFEPAGMYRTGVCHIQTEEIPHDNFVRNMVLKDGAYVPVADSDDRDVAAFDGLNGDDYVYSDIFDLFRWDRALREEKLLTREEQQQMYTPGKLNDGSNAGANEKNDGYGFGWGIRNDPGLGLIVMHSGGMPGLNTWFERFVDADRVLVLLNCREPRDRQAYEEFFERMRGIARRL
ncbi:MAG: serine hydrolase [Lachnospiraceae bacterium]|nr:serine hydrolase [Lachnospiraceae bacterium]